jgi:hypothetical protein
MKTVKITLCIFVLLAFSGLNETFGQWAADGANIHNTNAGNVGIGNFPAATLLHVGKNAVEPTIRVHNIGGVGGATFQMMDNFSGADWKFKATNAGGFKIRDHAAGLDVIVVEPNSAANSFYIDAAGNVAMSHAAPNGHGLYVLNYTMGKAAVQGTDESSGFLYATGMLGVLDGPAVGLPVYAYNVGVLGIKPTNGANGAAVFGWNNDAGNSNNYAGIFVSEGAASGTNYGIYSIARYATENFAGKFTGRVRIDGHIDATDAPDYTSHVLTAMVNHTSATDTRAVDGVSTPADGCGIGVFGTGGYHGVHGLGSGGAYAGFVYGVYGYATGTAGTRIGVYGTATGGVTNWAGYFVGDAYISSDLRIGTTTQATGYSLSVNGKVACEEVLVEDLTNWPDYVFAEDYSLMSLEDLEKSIQENNHLPGLPSATEIQENGLMLGDMQKRMMEKIEELTLYTIKQNKLISELQQRMENLEKENIQLKESISK